MLKIELSYVYLKNVNIPVFSQTLHADSKSILGEVTSVECAIRPESEIVYCRVRINTLDVHQCTRNVVFIARNTQNPL